jgi:hypothetical protein
MEKAQMVSGEKVGRSLSALFALLFIRCAARKPEVSAAKGISRSLTDQEKSTGYRQAMSAQNQPSVVSAAGNRLSAHSRSFFL